MHGIISLSDVTSYDKMLYLGSIEMDRVIRESCYKGTILQRSYGIFLYTFVKFHGNNIWEPNLVARTLKKYAHQRETTGSSSDSLRLCPFSKWELLLKERICSQSERIRVLLEQFLMVWKITFTTLGDLP